ncbi:Glycine oxidase ThiO [Liberibacter crescens BT-1]|uniref:Glycine oxidase ThiO n=1 Tax=Liberibacter crescens (strain BT-1) TaxID=1215343 RepID=L0EVX7_LIBCB|nr:FAD-binding oxidoreductase [Liberibacter crescens]AGA64828.1 Glycine oxidase ThiO [Liberibacter crescens BT-1]AMC12883.1 hypothetical protein RL73_04225 [Liberibacter crescens]
MNISDHQYSADLLLVGGGVMGLWSSLLAAREGISVVLVDSGRIASGASGGVVGVLMPYSLNRWEPKKQFQFEALVSLESEIIKIEAETGLSAEYHRCGRLIPLSQPYLRTVARKYSFNAQRYWKLGKRYFEWQLLNESPFPDLSSSTSADYGFIFDTLTAKFSPRKFCSLLLAAIKSTGKVTIIEEEGVECLDKEGSVLLTSGKRIDFGHVIIAAGFASFDIVRTLFPLLKKALGYPVKGQAALLKTNRILNLPVIFQEGLYVVTHKDGYVAVGSTHEECFEDPFSTNERLDHLIERSRILVPELVSASVIERWVGLRPRAIGREPMVGPLPGYSRIIMLSGGFKIGLGISHHLAHVALSFVLGKKPDFFIPEEFLTDSHVQLAHMD